MSKQSVHEVEDGLVKEIRPDCKCKLIVIAMPGLGKTTFVREHYGSWIGQPPWSVGDIDFGEWRKAHGIPRDWDVPAARGPVYAKFVKESVIPAMAKYDVVLCNEPGIIPQLPTDVAVVTAVPGPGFVQDWRDNLLARTADNISKKPVDLAAEQEFLVRVATQAQDWAKSPDWKAPMAMQLQFRSYNDWGILYRLMELMSDEI